MSSNTTSGVEQKEEVCAFCKNVAKKKCSSCKIVYYCSREHQKSDWKNHSKNCRVFKLIDDPTIGRHYVATRNIEIDEIVISEKALLVTPKLVTSAICLNCYVPLTGYYANSCKKCGWPLCRNCTRHGPECELTMKYRKSKVKIMDYSYPVPLYDAICVLRALALRDKSPGDYKKFMSLDDHSKDIMQKSKFRFDMKLLMYNSLKEHMKIDDLSVAEIMKIIGIVRFNGFFNTTPNNHQRVIVFDKSSYISNNCYPSCRATCYYDHNNEARMVVRAIRMIKKGRMWGNHFFILPLTIQDNDNFFLGIKGHPITIKWVDPLLCTRDRQLLLKEKKFIDCACERCEDPTEFGTMYSAIKCFEKDCTGSMLPPTFLVSDDDTIQNFVCDKCNLTTPSTTYAEIMNEFTEAFSKVDEKNVNQLQKFINNWTKILHENHFNIVRAELVLIDAWYVKINADPKCLTEKILEKTLILYKKLNSLFEIIAPGEYELRGLLLSKQLENMIRLRIRQPFQSSNQLLAYNEECRKVLTEARRLLRYELEDSDVGRLAKSDRLSLEEVNAILTAGLDVLSLKFR